MLDICDTTQLVVGFGIREIVLKFPLPGRIGGKSKSRLPFAGGIKLDQLAGHILGGFSGFGLGFLPCVGTDFVQPHIGIFAASADILAHQIQLRGGDEEGIAALIGDLNIVLNGTVHADLLHSHETSDAVVFVNHQIAGRKVGEGIQLLPVCGAFFGSFPLGRSLGDQLTFGKNGELRIGILHAVGKRSFGQQDLSCFGHGSQWDADERRQPLAAEHFLQKFCPAAGAAENKGREFHLLIMGQIGSGGVQIASVAGQLLGHHGQQHLRGTFLGIRGAAERVKIHGCAALQRGAEIFPLAHIVAQFACQQSALQETVQLHAHFVSAVAGAAAQIALITDTDDGIFRNVIHSGCHFRIDQCHIAV